MSETYVDRVLDGTALWTDIDDYIARWHREAESESIEGFLGMTHEDYSLFVEEPRSLRFILAAHESSESVTQLLEKVDEHAIAARGLDATDARKVRSWLVETGRLA
jgi:hypothetical protein